MVGDHEFKILKIKPWMIKFSFDGQRYFIKEEDCEEPIIAFYKFDCIFNRHITHICNAFAVDKAASHLVVYTLTVTFGAGKGGNHFFQMLFVHFTLFAVDNAAVHAGIDALKFCRFRPVCRRIFETYLR